MRYYEYYNIGVFLMFTNLDFLNVGKSWLPTNAIFKERQDNYRTGRLLYEGQFEPVFEDVWKNISTRYGIDYSDVQQVMVKVNLFHALTETFKILAFQQEPEIFLGEVNNGERLENDVYPLRKVMTLLKKAFVSAHAQGEGVIKVYTNSEGQADMSIVNPEEWIPVYNPDNLDEITHHVVARTYEVDNNTGIFGIARNNATKYLAVEIHEKGKYTRRLYLLDSNDVIAKLLEEEEVQTGFDGFAVFTFNYGTPSWRGYGKSAYDEIIPLIDELVTRISNNACILDKHANPTICAPAEAFEIDQRTGEKVLRTGYALQIGRDGAVPQYITWDGNLSSSENQISQILDLFYMISGTNPQLFGKDIAGNLSGEALSKILIVPIAKTKEMILSLEDAFEQAMNCMLKMRGVNKTVDIEFSVGQFNSEEDITNLVVMQKNAGIISLKKAVSDINPRYSKEEVQAEVEKIQNDQQGNFAMDLEDIYPKDTNEDKKQKEDIEDEQ